MTSTRFGQWAFRYRSFLPVPFAIALVLVRADEWNSVTLMAIGVALVTAGEAIRLWAVRHIGTISRTRSTRLGPLVTSGPYAWVRNPLYLGNLLLWTGFVCWSRLLWMLPISWGLFALQYRAIAAWEQDMLRSRFADSYQVYAREVGAWLPRGRARTRSQPVRYAWRDVLFSERGTLIAVAVMSMLMIGKDWLR